MARKSGYVRKLQTISRVVERANWETGEQFMMDCFMLALRDPEVMGKDVIGRDRIVKIMKAVGQYHEQFFPALTEDVEADYWRVKLDELLRPGVPQELFTPFEKRYEWLPQITYRKK